MRNKKKKKKNQTDLQKIRLIHNLINLLKNRSQISVFHIFLTNRKLNNKSKNL